MKPSGESARLEAYTDWLAIVVIAALVWVGKVPWEWGLGVIGGIAGVTGVAKGLGKPGGSLAILGAPFLKALAAFGASKLS